MNMNCNKKATTSLFRNLFLIIAGAGIMIGAEATNGDSVYVGFGIGLLLVGILQLVRRIRYQKDKAYQEQIDIAVSDERNHYLRMKAWSWTGYIVVIGCALATIVCMILKQEVYMQVFGSVVSAIVCVYWISFLVLSRKY